VQQYDEVARVYEERIAPKYAAIAGAVAASVSFDGVDRALEVAIGTGVLARLLVPQMQSRVRYLGIDIAPAMLSIARPHMPSNVDLMVADVRALPLPEASVDLVVGSLTPVQDLPEAIAEVRRVLVPDGRMALGFWGGRYRELRVLRQVRRDMGLGDYPVGAAAKAVHRIAGSGFVDIQREDIRIPIAHADVDTYLDYREAFGLVPWLPRQRQGDLRDAIRNRVQPYVHEDGSVHLDWTIVVLTARR